MLLADFHVHTHWSDGKLSLPEVVELFGRTGHDVIAITDHLVNTDGLLGRAAHAMHLSVTRDGWVAYRAAIDEAARSAWDRWRMVVIPGVELTRNAPTGGRSAHALALGLDDFVSADGPMGDVLARAREAGAVTVACHPNEQSEWFANTLYLWKRRSELGGLLDLWEIACRWDLFPPVAQARLAYIANSDFHSPKHLWAWKTLVDCEKSPKAILAALRRGTGLGITRLAEPAAFPDPTGDGARGPLPACPCLPALAGAV